MEAGLVRHHGIVGQGAHRSPFIEGRGWDLEVGGLDDDAVAAHQGRHHLGGNDFLAAVGATDDGVGLGALAAAPRAAHAGDVQLALGLQGQGTTTIPPLSGGNHSVARVAATMLPSTVQVIAEYDGKAAGAPVKVVLLQLDESTWFRDESSTRAWLTARLADPPENL